MNEYYGFHTRFIATYFVPQGKRPSASAVGDPFPVLAPGGAQRRPGSLERNDGRPEAGTSSYTPAALSWGDTGRGKMVDVGLVRRRKAGTSSYSS
jgi:hypothetical protein